MIPFHFRAKMGNYEVEVHGVKVKVSVISDASLVAGKVSQLRSFLKARRVMGLDFKVESRSIKQLLLCAGDHCLIIQTSSGSSILGSSELLLLFRDETICFVGVNMKSKVGHYVKSYSKYTHFPKDLCKSVVELGHLVARVLKKPNLQMSKLEELGGEVGLDIKAPTPLRDTPNISSGTSSTKGLKNLFLCVTGETGETGVGASREPDWSAEVFSEEEIKYAIHDAYGSYLIGYKLLGML